MPGLAYIYNFIANFSNRVIPLYHRLNTGAYEIGVPSGRRVENAKVFTWAYQIGCRRRQLIDRLLIVDRSDNLNSDKQGSRRIESCHCDWWFAARDSSAVAAEDVISGEILWVGADNSVSGYEAGCTVGVSLPHDSDLTSWYRIVWGCGSWWDSDIFYKRWSQSLEFK